MKAGHFLSLTLVFDGEYRHFTYDYAQKYGAVAEWRDRKAAR